MLMTVAGSGEKKTGPRLLFIDNIRILLICLVIMTHCSITYGGPGSWYFTDPGNATGAPFILMVIDSLNQAFFMGFFVLISAYFIPGSLMRKGQLLVRWQWTHILCTSSTRLSSYSFPWHWQVSLFPSWPSLPWFSRWQSHARSCSLT